MNYLAENALPIWIAGAVLLTVAAVFFLQLRTRGMLLAMLGIVVATAALLLIERAIETPREAVERTLYELADAVEKNDMAAALGYISPKASTMRSDVEESMPQVTIDKANVIGTPEITVDTSSQPRTAIVQCRGFIHATLKRNGAVGGQLGALTLTFAEDGDRWLVTDYKSDKDWRRAASGAGP